MKKIVLVCACIFGGAALLAAEDMDGLIKRAVDGLGSRLTAPVEVSKVIFLTLRRAPVMNCWRCCCQSMTALRLPLSPATWFRASRCTTPMGTGCW
jgi:hypothetical protein